MPYTTLRMAAAAEAAAERERAAAAAGEASGSDDPLAAAWVASLDRERAGKAAKWIPDTAVIGCMLCAKRFNLLRRRHHCRRCGACVCDACSSARVPASLLPEGHVRKPDKTKEQIGENEAGVATLVAQRSMDAIAHDTNLTYVRVCTKCAKTIDAQLKAQIKGRHRVPAPAAKDGPRRAAPQAPSETSSFEEEKEEHKVEEDELAFSPSSAAPQPPQQQQQQQPDDTISV